MPTIHPDPWNELTRPSPATNNPTAHTALNGGCVLHVRNTTEVRRVRMDAHAELALTFLKKALAGGAAEDRPSISLIVRRALKNYRDYVATLLPNPNQLNDEKQAIREHSHLPRRRGPATRTTERTPQ